MIPNIHMNFSNGLRTHGPASNQLREGQSPLLGHAAASLLTTWADHCRDVDDAPVLDTVDPISYDHGPPVLWLAVTTLRIRP
jgi:hypothetical protein